MTEQQDLSGLRIDHDRLQSGPERKFGKYYIAAAIVLAGVIAFLWFSGMFSAVPEVETTTATMTYPSSANAVLTASGYVVAQQKASLASKATGRLILLNVEEGDRVKKNQIIGQIEDQDVLAALAQVRANYELSKADLNDAKQTYDRQRSLFASGSASQAE
ncbi:MAG: biotin/lipoyl-binding protein, partial [bacterium]